jgi:hypothetical protein
VKLIREKAEQLICELYAHRHWLDALHNTFVFQHSDYTDPSPLDRAYSIQALHFPELRQQLEAVDRAALQLVRFSRTQVERQLQDLQTWLAQRDQSIAEQRPIHEAYIKASDAAIAAVVAAVQKRLDV